jgi:DNA-binding NarL/FixJ family response regulator
VAAQAIAVYADRVGVASALRTAVTAAEVMARLAERAADTILVDTALTRPDPVGFVRRALTHAPGATLVLFGPEDSQVAAAAVAAGARGVIRSGDQDLVTAVTKTLLLLCLPGRTRTEGGTAPAAAPGAGGSGTGPEDGGWPESAPVVAPPAAGTESAAARESRETLVPSQREEESARPRRPALTERELQVLRGMADGKSNAEIGRDLFVSEDTVKTHARRLFRKLNARDRAHAVAAGFRTGLVS